jgi:cysteinyl-tRNA synthetase
MATLKVYNTLSRRKEVFVPLVPGKVRMFVCGPTVQGPIHLGHARTYIFYDIVARYLSHLGMKVEFLMNITDVDEKISTAAKEAGTDPMSLASRYSKSFLVDLAALRISSVTRFEPVSRHVEGAMRQVSLLLRLKRAYAVDGWVYFDTSTFPRFGALSHQSKAELALRPLELSPNKRNLTDFSLWRPEVLVEGKWVSPWGVGSPGWHIQDTAITLAAFGPQYDIHGGAYELIYPHHEAEIAQGESITGVAPIVKYWVHTHLLTTAGEKMSKSLGNIYTVRDALTKYSPDGIRFYFLLTHYRRDVSLSGLETAVKRLERLREKVAEVSSRARKGGGSANSGLLKPFYAAMNDDFDTPRAIRTLERLADAGAAEVDPVKAYSVIEALKTAFGILGVEIVGSG